MSLQIFFKNTICGTAVRISCSSEVECSLLVETRLVVVLYAARILVKTSIQVRPVPDVSDGRSSLVCPNVVAVQSFALWFAGSGGAHEEPAVDRKRAKPSKVEGAKVRLLLHIVDQRWWDVERTPSFVG